MPRGSRGSYAISKAGVIMLTRVLARELDPKIRINAIAPAVRTPGNQAFAEFSDPEMLAQMLAHVPLGRFGELSEMGSVALFLASDAASYVTGHTLVADGGVLSDGGLNLLGKRF